ncbi:dipeptide ABC transporter ATP-binding protein [Chloroflexota bacterium]
MNSKTKDQPPTLIIEDLTVAYQHGDFLLDAVRDFSLQIAAGQTYGLVGESGSGKTTVAMAVMRYLGDTGVVLGGKIEFDGRDLLSLSTAEMRQVWGAEMSLVPQNPLSSLNPSIRVGEQLSEISRHHQGLDREAARDKTLELFRMVQLPDPQRIADSYPHQISGGMQQRVLIAMALSTTPCLLISDEPTTSLDVTTQASILDRMSELIIDLQSSILYVTHNLGVVAQICDRVAVLYAGELVEDAALEDLFGTPLHPYTQGLLDSVPRLGETKDEVQLGAIPGQIPALGGRPEGCVFEPRCSLAIQICSQRPPIISTNTDRKVRCHRWEEIASGSISPREIPKEFKKGGAEISLDQYEHKHSDTILDLRGVEVHFNLQRSIKEVIVTEPVRKVKAVDGVSLSLQRAQTLGLVGESGSGKTTLGRAIVGLVERTDGDIDLFGISLPPALSRRDFKTLRQLQMVFQNPEQALNPYLSIGASLRRPLMRLLKKSRREADQEVANLLNTVQLSPDYAFRMPNQISGGEKQRVAIARAFATNPGLLVADEPVSSLDVSVQASILNLLNELQIEYGSSMLFISHNLAVVGYLADVIAVIYLGKLMEVSRSGDLFKPPYHPYTEALLSAVPIPDPSIQQGRIRLKGDVPSPVDTPSGCPFHTRCPRFLGDICVTEKPFWQIDANGNRIYCHISVEELGAIQKKMIEHE